MDRTSEKPPVFIASDHAGFDLKALLCRFLREQGYVVKDLGPTSDEAVDYPIYAHRLSDAVSGSPQSLGVLLCGTGNGMAITANKHTKIRAALCWSEPMARLARAHNHANVLCLPARFLTEAESRRLLDCFLTTAFEGGRHGRRIGQIPIFEHPTLP